MSNIFSSALAQLMEQRDIPVSKISEVANVEQQTVQHWLAGGYPTRKPLERLCQFFDISESELMHGRAGFENGRLKMATVLAELAAEKNQAKLSIHKKAKVIALLYQHLVDGDNILLREIAGVKSISP